MHKFFICKHCGNLVGLVLNKGAFANCRLTPRSSRRIYWPSTGESWLNNLSRKSCSQQEASPFIIGAVRAEPVLRKWITLLFETEKYIQLRSSQGLPGHCAVYTLCCKPIRSLLQALSSHPDAMRNCLSKSYSFYPFTAQES